MLQLKNMFLSIPMDEMYTLLNLFHLFFYSTFILKINKKRKDFITNIVKDKTNPMD
jgi:hypothetical protein